MSALACVLIVVAYLAAPIVLIAQEHKEADMLAVLTLLLGAIVVLPTVGMILDSAS